MNENNPKISVIVPVYKAEAYLHRCIDSLLVQTFQDFEILLVDDGSPDRSGEICDEYARKDKRVRVFHKENGGVSSARNLGIEIAHAEWICFVDSDDWVETDYLSTFFQHNPSESKIILQGILFEYESTPPKTEPFIKYKLQVCKYPSTTELMQQKVLHDGCPISKMYNKSVLHKNGIRFIENLSTHEDHVFVWTYLNCIKEIQLCPTLSYHYMRRKNENTLSTKYHPAEEYILASNYLLQRLSTLLEKIQIEGTKYQKQVYSDYGLYQLLRACKNADSNNYVKIYNYVRTQKVLFHKYYISHTLQERIFIFFLMHKLLSNRQLFNLIKLLG